MCRGLLSGLVTILLLGEGGGPLEPRQIWGGGLRKGAPRATRLFPQCKCLKILAPACLWARGVGGQGCIRTADNRRRSPPPPPSLE